jgi:hypothetical protein
MDGCSGRSDAVVHSVRLMQAAPRTFQQLFTTDVQYEIPVFQRQYVLWLHKLGDRVPANERAVALRYRKLAGAARAVPRRLPWLQPVLR